MWKADLELRVIREALAENLDRHLPVEPRIPRPVDLPHPARPIGATISYGPRRAPETIVMNRDDYRRGFTQRSPEKRPKSESLECNSA